MASTDEEHLQTPPVSVAHDDTAVASGASTSTRSLPSLPEEDMQSSIPGQADHGEEGVELQTEAGSYAAASVTSPDAEGVPDSPAVHDDGEIAVFPRAEGSTRTVITPPLDSSSNTQDIFMAPLSPDEGEVGQTSRPASSPPTMSIIPDYPPEDPIPRIVSAASVSSSTSPPSHYHSVTQVATSNPPTVLDIPTTRTEIDIYMTTSQPSTPPATGDLPQVPVIHNTSSDPQLIQSSIVTSGRRVQYSPPPPQLAGPSNPHRSSSSSIPGPSQILPIGTSIHSSPTSVHTKRLSQSQPYPQRESSHQRYGSTSHLRSHVQPPAVPPKPRQLSVSSVPEARYPTGQHSGQPTGIMVAPVQPPHAAMMRPNGSQRIRTTSFIEPERPPLSRSGSAVPLPGGSMLGNGGVALASEGMASRRSGVDWIVPAAASPTVQGSEGGFFPPTSVGFRLSPTLKNARAELAKYQLQAKVTGWTLNATIGLQVLLGALTTGVAAATTGKQTSIAVTILGGLSTLAASYLARARGSGQPEASTARVKDLEHYVRDCEAFILDRGFDHGDEGVERIDYYRRRFEEILGNVSGGVIDSMKESVRDFVKDSVKESITTRVRDSRPPV